MTIDIDEQTKAKLAAARAAIAEAQAAADAYARDELDSVSARVTALHEKRARLGAPPVSASYATAADWTRARDQHIFDAEHCDRDLAEAEQRLSTAQVKHARLAAAVAPLREALWRDVLATLHTAAEAQTHEAARIATLHKSLLMRLPQEHWHWGQVEGLPIFRVEGAGFSDISKFVATVIGDGFGPDKSAALVAELGL